ncbi:MAG: LysR family transcriptional regulator [Luteimonas sp.]
MQRLDDLTLFLRVLDRGSITAAAHSLDLSPAVASQRLKRLERELGVRLLHRTTRSLHPTPEGAALARRGRALVEELESLGADLREAGSGVAGTLRVTAPVSFGRQYIAPLLSAFLARHPRLRISLNLDDRVVDLVGAGYDLAIRIGRLEDSGLVARPLAANRRLLCASPGYLAGKGTPESPADLARHDCLLLSGRDGLQDRWHLLDPAGSQVQVRVHGRLDSNHGEALRDAAVAGLGIALHSLWHVHNDLREGRLVQVLPDYPVPTGAIHAVMPERRLVPPRVRAFSDYLAASLGDPPWERG